MSCSNLWKYHEEETDQKQEIILTALIQQSASSNFGTWTGWGAEKLYEDTGIRINFYSNGSGNGQMLWQYMAAGTLPDVIGFDLSQIQLLKDTNLLAPLDQYEELLPSIFETEEYDNALTYNRNNFGGENQSLYALPVGVGEQSDQDFYWMPMIQVQPYEQVGTPEINSLFDYLDVVEKMLKYKSITAVGERVYGFSLYSSPDELAVEEASALSYLYGIDSEMVSNLMEYDMKTGVLSAITTEGSFYKTALQFYYEANQRGLLDPDARTQTYDSYTQKYKSGRILFSNYRWLTEDFNQSEVEKGFSKNNYIPLVADDMLIYKKPDNPIGNGWYYGITNNSKNQEAACVLLDWLYNPENIAYLYNGPEEETWSTVANEPVISENGWNIIQNGDVDSMEKYTGTFNGALEPFRYLGLTEATIGNTGYSLSYRYWPSTILKKESEQEKYTTLQNMEESISDYLEQNNMVIIGNTAVNLLSATSPIIRTKEKEIGKVVKEISWNMIYATNEEEFENLWNELVTKSTQLGIQDVEEEYQKLWEEALEKEQEYK